MEAGEVARGSRSDFVKCLMHRCNACRHDGARSGFYRANALNDASVLGHGAVQLEKLRLFCALFVRVATRKGALAHVHFELGEINIWRRIIRWPARRDHVACCSQSANKQAVEGAIRVQIMQERNGFVSKSREDAPSWMHSRLRSPLLLWRGSMIECESTWNRHRYSLSRKIFRAASCSDSFATGSSGASCSGSEETDGS